MFYGYKFLGVALYHVMYSKHVIYISKITSIKYLFSTYNNSNNNKDWEQKINAIEETYKSRLV